MTPLPTGYTLCRPASPDPRCHNCRRWEDHHEQVLGMVTRVVNTSGQRDPACVHFPISYLKDAK